MKRNYPLITLLTLLSFGLWSQSALPDIELSRVYEHDKYYDPEIVEEDEDFLYTLDYLGDEEYMMGKIDKESLQEEYRRTSSMTEKFGVTEALEKITFLKDQFALFYSLEIGKEDVMELWVDLTDAKNGRSQDRKKLLSLPKVKWGDKTGYAIYTSPEKKRILVRGYAYQKKQERTEELFVLYDEEMEEVARRKYNHSGEAVLTGFQNITLDDEGMTFFLSNNDELVVLDPFLDFEEWREPIPTEMLESPSQLGNIHFDFDPDMNLIMTAMYHTKDTETYEGNKDKDEMKKGDVQTEGVYYLRFDPLKKEIQQAKLNKFSKDFIQTFQSHSEMNDDEDAEMETNIRDAEMNFLEDGTMILTAQERETEAYYYDGTYNHFRELGDLVVLRFDPDGALTGTGNIDRSGYFVYSSGSMGSSGSHGWDIFKSPGTMYASYMDPFFYVKGDKVYSITYLDEGDIPLGPAGLFDIMKKLKKGVLVLSSVDLNTGETVREGMLNSLTSKKRWMDVGSAHRSEYDDQVYFFSSEKKNHKIGRLKF